MFPPFRRLCGRACSDTRSFVPRKPGDVKGVKGVRGVMGAIVAIVVMSVLVNVTDSFKGGEMARVVSDGDGRSGGTASLPNAPVAHQDRDDGQAADTANVDGSPAEASGLGEELESSHEYPVPAVLGNREPFIWDEDAPTHEKYERFGRRLSQAEDLYRISCYGGGLYLGSEHSTVPPRQVLSAAQLAPLIVDRVSVCVVKNGKPSGSQIASGHVKTMLASEVFLQQFRLLDEVVNVPKYLADFTLTEPGYNDGGPGQRVLYVGPEPEIHTNPDTINPFLDVMAFASNADRTNAVAAALTVMLRNHWPGAKPLLYATSTKSHGGKDTVIEFACGGTLHTSLSYEKTDWALQKNFCALVHKNPGLGVVVVENVRLDAGRSNAGGAYIRSAFLERFLTDPNPALFSTGTGDPRPRKNDFVLAMSTNFGRVSDDLMNRALPIRLEPVGDVARRHSPIGNPRLEYLPANRERIEAELRGMIERWKVEGMPLDDAARHPFSDWARTVGGILQVNGFEDFLANYGLCGTEDDPIREALGLLGAARRNEWLTASRWAQEVARLGLVKRLIPEADRDSTEGRQRGIGVVLSARRDETLHMETDDERLVLRLERRRRRFNRGEDPSTRYRFAVLDREAIPEDPDEGGDEDDA